MGCWPLGTGLVHLFPCRFSSLSHSASWKGRCSPAVVGIMKGFTWTPLTLVIPLAFFPDRQSSSASLETLLALLQAEGAKIEEDTEVKPTSLGGILGALWAVSGPAASRDRERHTATARRWCLPGVRAVCQQAAWPVCWGSARQGSREQQGE